MSEGYTYGSGLEARGRLGGSAIVSQWPEPFDMELDILINGKADRFRTAMKAALRTRGLWGALAVS